MENKNKPSKLKRTIQIGGFTFIGVSIIGYIFYPIITGIFNILFVWFVFKWLKKRGVRVNFHKKIK